MRQVGAAVALFLAALCAGCESWSGFGFRADGAEMPRLVQALAIEPGKVVADVGAGKGELTVALAREVGPRGHVFSTEIDPARLRRLRAVVVAAKLDNVTVIEAAGGETGLPLNCCDAVVLRRVYHHLIEPAGVNASLLRSLRPGGLLAVIDFPPPFFLGRGRFGVPAQDVVSEVSRSGFEPVRLLDDWPGRGPLASFCALFRKPR
jgi:ubiquinone/menaquinone biosynthesis C-methylase UbiE